MSKAKKIQNFDPNGVGLNNDHFIGLPFDEEDAEVILFPVPWDVTVSYSEGTSLGPENILAASTQLDLYDPFVNDAWKLGIYMVPVSEKWVKKNIKFRKKSIEYIDFLENGGVLNDSEKYKSSLQKINQECEDLKNHVYKKCKNYLSKGKLIGLVGGEHSVPLGYLKALAEQNADFGILQIDAHMDLRKAYEGFEHSHASIFYNASKISSISKIVQVGIRDYCEAEVDFVKKSAGRIKVFYDHEMKHQQFKGANFHQICIEIIKHLPQKIYISFDIDGLDPSLCPNTGTPVPGGLDFNQSLYLINLIVESGRTIIGFDLCEVNGKNEWDGSVGAKVLYRLSNLMGKSNGKI
jgi:agmatinase